MYFKELLKFHDKSQSMCSNVFTFLKIFLDPSLALLDGHFQRGLQGQLTE